MNKGNVVNMADGNLGVHSPLLALFFLSSVFEV
jgi:hypothetical protein